MRSFFAALILLLGHAASAQLFPLSGRLFIDAYLPTDTPVANKTFQQFTGSLWLESNPVFTDEMGSKWIYQGDVFDGPNSIVSGESRETHLESSLREGYLYYRSGSLDLTAGQQIIPWGKSDGINPTDFHTAKNNSFFNPDDEVKRRGAASVKLNFTPEEGAAPWTFTTIWTPIFARSKHLISSQSIPSGVTLRDPEAPPVTFSNGEISEKVAYTGSGWDASLSYFNGWNHKPELQERSHRLLGFTPVVDVEQVFRRIQAVGMDGSYSTELWVYRIESAYIVTENHDGENPLVMPTHWDSVLGAERPFGDHFRVQGQFVMRYFPRFKSADQVSGPDAVSTGVNRTLASTNALLLGYQEQNQPAGSLRVSYTDQENAFESEIFFLQNFNGSDFLIRPKMSYGWTDLIRSTLGAEVYGGPTSKPLGALHPYNSIFFETKYTF